MEAPPYTKTNQAPGKVLRYRTWSHWTDDAERALIRLHGSDLSAAGIANALTSEGHGPFTRNAVLGKIKRLRDAGALSVPVEPSMPKFSTISTSAVLGTFLERLCDVGSW